MRVALLTAITNGYDTRRPGHAAQSIEFERYDAGGDVVDPLRVAYWYKYHPQLALPDHVTHSIWVDGNITITNPGFVAMCLEAVERSPIGWAAWKHPDRACVYDEVEAIIEWRLQKWPLVALARQVEVYRTEAYPAGRGLFALGCIARRHDEHSRTFDELVWAEQQRWCGSMDQVCVPYVDWRHFGGRGVAAFDGVETDGTWMDIGGHN